MGMFMNQMVFNLMNRLLQRRYGGRAVLDNTFKGMSLVFSTKDEKQYEEIGAYWDYFSSLFGRENLEGLGYNWTEDTIEYVIGSRSRKLKFDQHNFWSKYPKCEYKEIELPTQGWITYNGETEKLGQLYEEIYKDGPLTYEIETFSEDGSCQVQIFR